jgi:formate hydrogenlyase subunit 6/NADH:ubiquinone oxidoreductase subunit I
VPTLVKDPNGREKCVSCQLCEFVCPPKAIRITPGEVPGGRRPRRTSRTRPQAFDIDMLRCIYCGLCQEVCPEEAIFLQNQYSMTGYTRAEMVNHKDGSTNSAARCPTSISSGTRKRPPRSTAHADTEPGSTLHRFPAMAALLFYLFSAITAVAPPSWCVVSKNAVNAAMCFLL